jgi:hypothetical protein
MNSTKCNSTVEKKSFARSIAIMIQSYEEKNYIFLFDKWNTITVPKMKTGCCLGSEGNGVSVGEGSEGGPRPPERGKDK